MSKFTSTKIPTASTGDRPAIVKEFLANHYDVKINIFDTSRTIIVPKNKALYKHEPTLVDLSLHMETCGIRGCDTILKKILSSPNQVTTFNPITEYIQSLEGIWKGESHIDKLCQYIIARQFDDKPEGYYQDRMKRLLKKWMAASIACSLGVRENDAMLGFIHADEGIGKTYLLEYLVPKCLKGYYVKSDKEERYFNITTAFSRNFMINFDEFVGITKASAETVKKVLSSTEFTLSNSSTHMIPRIGNGVFTSNKTSELGGFLTKEMGHRRFAVIELDRIEQGYTAEVEVDQLWAEAYVLFKNANFDYKWNKADFEELKQDNARYIIETQALKLVKMYYRKPEPDEEPIHKQPLEILQDLQRAKKLTNSMINVSDVTLGFALKQLGYEHKSKKLNGKPRYGYNVIPLFE